MQSGIDIQGLVRHSCSLQKAFEYGTAFRQEDLEEGINMWVDKNNKKAELEKLRQRRAMDEQGWDIVGIPWGRVNAIFPFFLKKNIKYTFYKKHIKYRKRHFL